MFYQQQNMTVQNLSNSNGSFRAIPANPYLISADELHSLLVAQIFCLAIIGLFSLLGNTSLLAVIYFNQRMRNTANYLFVNMAISDLLYVLFVTTTLLRQLISYPERNVYHGVFGEILCRFVPFIRDVSCTVSILSMIAISVDRYFAVVHPLRPKPFFLKTKIVLTLTWFVSAATFSVYFYVFRLDEAVCISSWPEKEAHKYLYLFIVGCYFVLPFSIMTVLYSTIIQTIKRQEIPGNQTSEMESARRKRNKNITKLGVFIILWFFISWAPYHSIKLLQMLVWKRKLPAHFAKSVVLIVEPATALLSITSIASNPCVCYTCSTNFRKCLTRLLRRASKRERADTTILDYTRGSPDRRERATTCRKSIGIPNNALDLECVQRTDTKL